MSDSVGPQGGGGWGAHDLFGGVECTIKFL